MVIGKIYRNKHMRDVDFYVLKVLDSMVQGYWISRITKAIVGPLDRFEPTNKSDWTEIKEEMQ